jgi:hypothetical protein
MQALDLSLERRLLQELAASSSSGSLANGGASSSGTAAAGDADTQACRPQLGLHLLRLH